MAYSINAKDYFNTKLYTGTGAENAVTGVGFQPDFTWLKNRATTNHHTLFDAVRGANKVIYSNLDAQQYTVTQELKSFDSDGFTVGTEASANGSGNGIVSWNWRAGNSAGSSNTDGSITSTVSANTTSGFSIVTYTGTGSAATVGHGLGSAPSVIIQKKTSGSATWLVKHPGIGTNGYIRLDSNAVSSTDSAIWNNTDPTSTVFSIGTDATINASGATSVAYCFAEKTGFSKFGTYFGNGQASDNAFCYCGFKPQFILHKNVEVGENWLQWDTPRNTAVNYDGNPTQVIFEPNTSGAESNASARAIDVVSNGFKIKGNNENYGANLRKYIFMAFAEAPLVGTNNVPATAR